MGGLGSGRRRSVGEQRCPKHPEVRATANGTYRVKGQQRRRFICEPSDASRHVFSVVVRRDASTAVLPTWTPPPPCPTHPSSDVVRHGRYGKHTAKRRQRYLCRPLDGSPAHTFTPPLPRDHVPSGHEQCEVCEELVGTHHGQAAVARRHTWSARLVAHGLDKLSSGDTYANVSNWAIRAAGVTRSRRKAQTTKARTAPGAKPTKKVKNVSAATRRDRAAWHIAADWVEAFSPVLYGPLDERLRAEALAERTRLDALRRARRRLDRPQVVLIDDVPVWGRDPEDKSGRTRQAGFAVLVVAELYWPDPATLATLDPEVLDASQIEDVSRPVTRLRLVRAMPNVQATSWLLVLDELGYTPDVVVSDGGTGADLALRTLYANTPTTVIPSLWHLNQTIQRAFDKVPGAWGLDDSGQHDLVQPLRDHLRKLSRSSGVLRNSQSWASWWDDLLGIVTELRLPVEKLRKSRAKWEAPVAASLSAMRRYPRIPVSTGGLETLIARRVQPLLGRRGNAFANIERTNLLFDLVVARDHGVFTNLNDVARTLRADAESADGWTVPLRTISDPRPNKSSYSSLRDAVLIDDLARSRGLIS